MELGQAQRAAQKAQRLELTDSATHNAVMRTNGHGGTSRKRPKQEVPAWRGAVLSLKALEQKQPEAANTARALLHSLSELAAEGDAAGVAKACALLSDDSIDAFSLVEGEDERIRERRQRFAEDAIDAYANRVEDAEPTADELRELGARAVDAFVVRALQGAY